MMDLNAGRCVNQTIDEYKEYEGDHHAYHQAAVAPQPFAFSGRLASSTEAAGVRGSPFRVTGVNGCSIP